MSTRLILCCIFALPVCAFADANDGQFMGYELGSQYPAVPQNTEISTTGNLLIQAEEPVKPANIDRVVLVATPESRTIGYIVASSWHATEDDARAFGRRYVELLRAKYANWDFGREQMDASMRIVAVNFDRMPYNLQLSLAHEEHDGRMMWRVSMLLGWNKQTAEWQAWQKRAVTESMSARAAENDQLLEESDTRGL